MIACVPLPLDVYHLFCNDVHSAFIFWTMCNITLLLGVNFSLFDRKNVHLSGFVLLVHLDSLHHCALLTACCFPCMLSQHLLVRASTKCFSNFGIIFKFIPKFIPICLSASLNLLFTCKNMITSTKLIGASTKLMEHNFFIYSLPFTIHKFSNIDKN